MPLRSTLRPLLKKHSGLFFNVLFIVTVLLGVGAFQARNMLPTTEADIPTLRGPLLRGGNYDLADAGNRPVLVYFFAPWCNFCSASSDNLTRLRRLRDEESLEILVVASTGRTTKRYLATLTVMTLICRSYSVIARLGRTGVSLHSPPTTCSTAIDESLAGTLDTVRKLDCGGGRGWSISRSDFLVAKQLRENY
jgi:thiol-disulfide isomerase/thioredoxin